MKRSDHIQGFCETIWKWYSVHKRTLPWRDLEVQDDTQRAYQVFVSEIMLQQTQVPRVKIIYPQFLEKFPTLEALSKATNKEMILAWRGMGYNNRALRMRDTAKAIVENGGVFPKEMDALLALKGIGHYTAGAIRNFAYGIPTACIDTNIRRILHRAFVGPETAEGEWKKDDKYLLDLAEKVLKEAIDQVESGKLRADSESINSSLSTINSVAADWHAALMDYGSLVCIKRSPKWDVCPLTNKNLMKAAYKVPELKKKTKKKEPGRLVGSTYIPNRIFRGKVIEELRDEPALPLEEIGQRICIDWSEKQHKDWLSGILQSLQKDQLLVQKGSQYSLA